MDVVDIPNINGRTVEATETSFYLIEALKRLNSAGVTELATELDIPKGTVHKHLNTLRGLNYVVKQGTTYSLSVSFLGLGNAARTRIGLHEVAQGPLEKLADTVGETASIMIPEHGYGVYTSRVIPSNVSMPTINEGDRVPLHATAGGKAILAYLPDEVVERILDQRGLTAETNATITDRRKLLAELQVVHDRRSAYDRNELVEGLYCVASPITNPDHSAIGAVTISGTGDRLGEKLSGSDIGSFLGSTADSIQNRLRSH